MGSYTSLGKRFAGLLKYSHVLIRGLGDTILGVFWWAISIKFDLLAWQVLHVFGDQIGLHILSCPVRETQLVGLCMANLPQ